MVVAGGGGGDGLGGGGGGGGLGGYGEVGGGLGGGGELGGLGGGDGGVEVHVVFRYGYEHSLLERVNAAELMGLSSSNTLQKLLFIVALRPMFRFGFAYVVVVYCPTSEPFATIIPCAIPL